MAEQSIITPAPTPEPRKTVPQSAWPEGGTERLGACPACGAAERTILYTGLRDRIFFCAPGDWEMHCCGGCGAGYLDPRPTPETIGLAYQEYYTHRAQESPASAPPSSLLGKVRRALRNGYVNRRYGYRLQPASALGPLVMSRFPAQRAAADRWVRSLPSGPAPRRVLDVGCGSASFLKDIREAGWEVVGLDPDPAAVRAAREADIEVIEGLLTPGMFPPVSFNAVTLSHVIEHVHDPAETLQLCHDILKPGGYLWITTPNLGSPSHRRFGADWRGLEPPRHLIVFTVGALFSLLKRIGFQIESGPLFMANSTWYFAASNAIRQGEDPTGILQGLPEELRLEASACDVRAQQRPEDSEEVTVLAVKR